MSSPKVTEEIPEAEEFGLEEVKTQEQTPTVFMDREIVSTDLATYTYSPSTRFANSLNLS